MQHYGNTDKSRHGGKCSYMTYTVNGARPYNGAHAKAQEENCAQYAKFAGAIAL